MALWKQLFSTHYRRAVGCEARGDLLGAAEGYALANEPAHVARLHLQRASLATTPDERLASLRSSVEWASRDADTARETLIAAASELERWAIGSSIHGARELEVLTEAAQAFELAEDHVGAARCFERAGDGLRAAESYQRAGEIDRLEELLLREEQRRKREQGSHDALQDYRFDLSSGARAHALAALERALELGADGADDLARLRDDLALRLCRRGYVRLRDAEGEITYVSGMPAVVGRDPGCAWALRDPALSRRHLEVSVQDGRFMLRDLGARNGTRLHGLPLEPGRAELPLEGQGTIGVGETCEIAYRRLAERLELRVTRGVGVGTTALLGPSRFELAAGIELAFVSGLARLVLAPDRHVLLNGVRVTSFAELMTGDRIEDGGRSWEVLD